MTHRQRIFLNLAYLLIGLWIWGLLYRSIDLPYDDNVAYILAAFGLSAIVFTALTILVFKYKALLQENYHCSLIFLLTCSPITIGLVLLNYGHLFGRNGL